MEYLKLVLISGLFSLISACSGGGGGGAPAVNAADINSDNAQQLSIAATEGAKQSVLTDSVNIFTKTSPTPFDAQAFSEKILNQTQQSSDLGPLCSSGTYNNSISDTTGNGSISFTNCDLSGTGVVLNGTITVVSSNNGASFSMTYSNFSIAFQGNTETISFTLSCDTINNAVNCTQSSSSITGIDGRAYSVSNVSVTPGSGSTFNVSCDVVDPDNGQISVNAQLIDFNCTSPNQGRPSTGSITFSSNGESGQVTFDNCSSYTVTVDGVANSFTWN